MKQHAMLCAAALGCSAEVPETPSFQVDVMPILAANCVHCHADPVIGGAPLNLRLDSYDSASKYAELVKARVVPGAVPGPMPPRFPLDDDQVETLVRWVDQGAMRGAPRPANRMPTITVEAVGRQGTTVELAVAIDDADGDLVTGEIYARGGATERFVGAVRSGQLVLAWDVQMLPGSAIELVAKLDDGASIETYELGTVEVAP